jgi:hypothetical protein
MMYAFCDRNTWLTRLINAIPRDPLKSPAQVPIVHP